MKIKIAIAPTYIVIKIKARNSHSKVKSIKAERMKEKIEDIKFNKPEVKIISNVNARPEEDPEKIKQLLIKQIYSTVKWREMNTNIIEKT